MRSVIAALDASATARLVLDTALGVGPLVGAEVTAVHVRDGRPETPEWLAARDNIPLRILDGANTESLLLEAVAGPDVIVAVFGARSTTGGRRPVGHIALHVLEQSRKPIVIVPPEATGVSPRAIRRLLVPLEGSEQSSAPVDRALSSLIVAQVELVVLHVFTKATLPPILDRPHRDLALWSDEFLARFCPTAAVIELRSGAVGRRVGEVCDEQQADMVVLSWSQDISPGHAAVISDVLAHSTRPVMLLPVGPTPRD